MLCAVLAVERDTSCFKAEEDQFEEWFASLSSNAARNSAPIALQRCRREVRLLWRMVGGLRERENEIVRNS